MHYKIADMISPEALEPERKAAGETLRTIHADKLPPPDSPIAPVVVRAGYYIGFEEFEGRTFVHCTVWEPWTRAIRTALMCDADTLCKWRRGRPLFILGVAPHADDRRKYEKFASLLGFRLSHSVKFINGSEAPVYVRET